MRRARLKIVGQSAGYHIVCRVTQGQEWLGNGEKAYLTALLHRVAMYCGVEVVTFCIMSNHFHLLVRVPEKVAADARVDDQQLLERVRKLYGVEVAQELRGLAETKALWDEAAAMHRARMHELSVFMKLLKQRFTMWHNFKHGTRGTLWTERFKSLLVEIGGDGKRNPLELVAAYIDLNPVRAGIVKDAAEYPFSGLGSAGLGNVDSQQGLASLRKVSSWQEAKRWYQEFIAGSVAVLRSRQGALVKGWVLGSAAFVVDVLLEVASLRRNIRPLGYAVGGLGEFFVGKRFRGG